MVPRLIRTCRIQLYCSPFSFLTCKFCPKNPFDILMLPDQSPSSFLLETWSKWLFLFIFSYKLRWKCHTKNQNVLELSVILPFILLMFAPWDPQTIYRQILILKMEGSLRKKYPNMEFFLVRSSPCLDWIRENTDQKKLRICALYT